MTRTTSAAGVNADTSLGHSPQIDIQGRVADTEIDSSVCRKLMAELLEDGSPAVAAVIDELVPLGWNDHTRQVWNLVFQHRGIGSQEMAGAYEALLTVDGVPSSFLARNLEHGYQADAKRDFSLTKQLLRSDLAVTADFITHQHLVDDTTPTALAFLTIAAEQAETHRPSFVALYTNLLLVLDHAARTHASRRDHADVSARIQNFYLPEAMGLLATQPWGAETQQAWEATFRVVSQWSRQQSPAVIAAEGLKALSRVPGIPPSEFSKHASHMLLDPNVEPTTVAVAVSEVLGAPFVGAEYSSLLPLLQKYSGVDFLTSLQETHDVPEVKRRGIVGAMLREVQPGEINTLVRALAALREEPWRACELPEYGAVFGTDFAIDAYHFTTALRLESEPLDSPESIAKFALEREDVSLRLRTVLLGHALIALPETSSLREAVSLTFFSSPFVNVNETLVEHVVSAELERLHEGETAEKFLALLPTPYFGQLAASFLERFEFTGPIGLELLRRGYSTELSDAWSRAAHINWPDDQAVTMIGLAAASDPQGLSWLPFAGRMVVGRDTGAVADAIALELAGRRYSEKEMSEFPVTDLGAMRWLSSLASMQAVPVEAVKPYVTDIFGAGWTEYRTGLDLLRRGGIVASLVEEEWNSLGGITEQAELLEHIRKLERTPETFIKYAEGLLLDPALSDNTVGAELEYFLQNRVSEEDRPAMALSLLDAASRSGWRPGLERILNAVDDRYVTSDFYLDLLSVYSRTTGVPNSAFKSAMQSVFQEYSSDDDLLGALSLLRDRGWDQEFAEIWKQAIVTSSDPSYRAEVLRLLRSTEGVPAQSVASLYERAYEDLGHGGRFLLARGLAGDQWNGALDLVLGFDKPGRKAELSNLDGQRRHKSVPASVELPLRSPSNFERLVTGLLAQMDTPARRDSLRLLARRGQLAPVAEVLLPEGSLDIDGAEIHDLTNQLLARVERNPGILSTARAPDFRVWPRSSMPNTRDLSVDPRTSRQTMAIIGDGPAAILMARMRREMGYQETATTIFSASGHLGGIWTQNNVLEEGHNTFRNISAWDAELKAVEPRYGSDLKQFLDRIVVNGELQERVRKGLVEAVSYDSQSRRYIVQAKEDGHVVERAFDSVLVATGNRRPRGLDYGPMKTNAVQGGLALIRWQHQIDSAHYEKYEGTRPLIVGLGNSAIAMIGEFQRMRDAGVNVNPVVISHHSDLSMEAPEKFVIRTEGRLEDPLYRGPFNLSRLAGDIERIRSRYLRAKEDGWIFPDIREWNALANYDSGTQRRSIEIINAFGEGIQIDDVRHFYVLIGYQNSVETMRRFGIRVEDSTGTPSYDVATGRVQTTFATDNPGRMYVAGAAASRPGDRNHEVIPGMMTSIPWIAFSEVVSSIAEQEHGKRRVWS